MSGHVASLLLASQSGIAYGKYATPEDRAELRAASAGQSFAVQSVAATIPARSRPIGARVRVKPTKDNSIFVVHGRDKKLTDDIYAFLRVIGLNPMEWNEAIKRAKGGANPIVGDVIHQAMERAQGVLVLLSPDEQAKLRRKFAGAKDRKKGLHALEGQPRPNVIFEAGLALGAHSDKTILVQVGDIREISDIAGKHMVHLSNDPASRNALAARLRDKLKFTVSLDGDDWLELGDFNR